MTTNAPHPPAEVMALRLADVATASRARAEKWRRTLLPALERLNSPLLSRAELERIAVENSTRQFGRPKSRRHVRRMLAQVIDRDDDRHEWERPELYLEKNPSRISAPAEIDGDDFAELQDASQSFTNPDQPSSAEEAVFLGKAWSCYQRMVSGGAAPKRAKADLLEHLWARMPWLSDSRAGLTAKIARKFKHHEQAHGEPVSLLDGRVARAGVARAPEFNQEYLDHLIWHAAKNCGGRVAQAVEDLIVRGEEFGLPTEFVEFLASHRRPDGQINRRLMAAVKPEVEMLRPYFLGQGALDDATVPMQRSYDKLRSMTVVNADDFTMPVYSWLKDAKGQPVLNDRGRPEITRGQVLLFMDVRSRRIIAWSLIPHRNYNSLAIRTCMNMVCREHGIPAVWYFECGIWKNSHAVKQTAPAGWDAARSGGEFEFGWGQLGAKFIHAIRARSKPIEKVGDWMQRLMEGEPGYCGRDERRDCPEETRLAKLAVEAGRVHPSRHFMSFDEWEERLGQIVERYNAKPQGGILNNQSPDEAFEANWPHEDPPTPLDAKCWHLCAHLVRKFKVGDGGITFKIGKQRFAYWDETLSASRHREVLAWFNPETPEFIAVTELNDRTGKTARFVSRHAPVDFLATLQPDSPEAEAYRQEVAKQQGFNAYPKARFHALKSKFKPTFRAVVADHGTASMATALQRGTDGKRAEMKSDASRRSGVIKRAGRLGLASLVGEGDQCEDAGVRMMEQAARVMDAEADGDTETDKK